MWIQRVTGTVQSGAGADAIPFQGAFVTLFQAGDHAANALWSTRTDEDGPEDTFHAMVHVARRSRRNRAGLYAQSQAREVYQPWLHRLPDAWSLPVA
jgi:hypothetical protein